MNNELDDIFLNDFLKEFKEKEKKKIFLNKEEQAIALKKSHKLEPIKMFLQKFVDLGVVVYNAERYNRNVFHYNTDNQEQEFKYYESDSSESWAPGISICFEHPAQVEIAIPNKPEEGIVIIKVASQHPDYYLLEQKFSSMESACHALAKFLGKNTIKISKKADLLNNQINKNKYNQNFFDNVPDTPPEE